MNAIYYFILNVPGLRNFALGPVKAPPQPDRTGHHSFAKVGPDGERMLLVLDADDHNATETITTGGRITSETTTPIGAQGLAIWYAHRYAELLAEGWQPVAVTTPLQVPSHP